MITTSVVVSVIGMVACFLFLGLIVITTYATSYFFSDSTPHRVETPAAPKVAPSFTSSTEIKAKEPESNEAEIAIALAVAVAKAQ